MALAIPNTTTQNEYAAATTFTADVDLVTGSLTVANNPAIVQAIYGSSAQRSFGPEVYVAPTVIPLAAPPNKPLRGVRVKSAVAGQPAQVFGSIYTANEPSLGAGTPFGATVTAAGAVGQAVVIPRVSALPAGPTDTQMVLYSTGVAGVEWLLTFNSSTGKWDYVGGPPLIAEVLTLEGPLAPGGGYVDLATVGPSVTLPALVGDWIVECSMSFANASATANTGGVMAYTIGATAASDSDACEAVSATSNTASGFKATLKTGLAASALIRGKYKTTGGSQGSFSKRVLRVWPVGNLS